MCSSKSDDNNKFVGQEYPTGCEGAVSRAIMASWPGSKGGHGLS